jgi:hypothetical protein
MKTRLLIIIGILIFVTMGVIIYLDTLPYFSPSTNENPYGIEAKVMIQSTYVSPPIQQDEPIKPQDVLWFRYNTKELVNIIGFTICNGSNCITHQPGSGPPLHPEPSAEIDLWGGGTLGDLPWKIGDIVHIWVNTRHVYSSGNGDLIDLNDPVSRIDLGESKITRGDTMRI